jgi:hypothetical protein
MPTIHADTPQDLLDVLILWANDRHTSALRHTETPNQSRANREGWAMRAGTARALCQFLATIEIVPRTAVAITPPPSTIETATEEGTPQ